MSLATGGFNNSLRNAGQELRRFGTVARQTQTTVQRMDFRPVSTGVTAVRAGIAGLGAAVAAIGTGAIVGQVTAGIGTAVGAASDLNEQVAKSQVVFGKSSAIVEAKAKEMGDAFGYPKTQFIEGASSIGLIAKASGLSQSAAAEMGSSFAALAADASSFYNVPVEDALNAIRSGLVGEAEPMRRFGVLLNEAAVKSEAMRLGLAKAGAELTEGQKVQARASLITRGLADAQGDLARTSNSVANMARAAGGRWTNAMADVGTAIQPVTEKLYGLRDAVMKTLTEELNKNADAFKAWAQQAAASGGIVDQAFVGIGKSVGFVADGIQALGIGLLGAKLAATDLWASFLEGLMSAGSGFDRFMASMGQNFPKMVTAADLAEAKARRAGVEQTREDLAAAMMRPAASEAIRKRFAAARAGAGVAGAGAAKAAPAVVEPVNAKATKAVDDLTKSLQTEIATFGMAGKAAEIYKLQLAGASKEQIAAVKALDRTLRGKQMAEAVKTPAEQFAAAKKEADELYKAGAIDKTTYQRNLKLQRENILGKEGVRFAGATMAGTAEAYSAQLRNVTRESTKDEPIKEVAKTTKEHVDVSKQILNGINKLVEKGAGVLGTATAELLPI